MNGRRESWNAANGLPYAQVNTLVIDPLTSGTLYAGTYYGVFKSVDGGVSWNAVNTGLTNDFITALAIDPQMPATLYAGTGVGVFKERGWGENWIAANSGLTNTSVSARWRSIRRRLQRTRELVEVSSRA